MSVGVCLAPKWEKGPSPPSHPYLAQWIEQLQQRYGVYFGLVKV